MSRSLICRRTVVCVCFVGCLLGLSFGLTCPPDGGGVLDPTVPQGNRPPRVIITDISTPSGDDYFAQQGDLVTISFTAEDGEDQAIVRIFASFSENPTPEQEIHIMTGFAVGPGAGSGAAAWDTTPIVPGSYYLFAEIDDGTYDAVAQTGNPPVRVTAAKPLTVASPGTGHENGSPTVAIELPAADAGLTNGDIVTLRFRVKDPNSDEDTVSLTYYLDWDRDTSNDDVQPPLVVGTGTLLPGTTAPDVFSDPSIQYEIEIDLNEIPVRIETDEGGRPLPYYVRVRADDGTGGVVDVYAVGAVRILASATDVVDLRGIGGTVAGAVWQGFNGEPNTEERGSRAGSSFVGLGDMDGDGLDDFAIAAQTATPFDFDNVGEAYVIYGRERSVDPDLPSFPYAQGRYAGINKLNTVGSFVPFPPSDSRYQSIFNIRGNIIPHPNVLHGDEGGSGSLGITCLGAVPDLTDDGRPELLIGSPFNDSVIDAEDNDPCDECDFDDGVFSENPFLALGDTEAQLLEGEWDGEDTINASEWAPIDPVFVGPFDTENVDMELDEAQRITSVWSFVVHVEGTRGDDTSGAFRMDVLLEDQDGPMLTGSDAMITNFPTTTPGEFVQDLRVTLPFPEFPVGPDDFLPPSVYDGRFWVFLRPSVGVKELDVTIRMQAFLAETVSHPYRFTYLDGFPDPFSDAPNCGASEPVNPLALERLDPVCPPLARQGQDNTDGHFESELGFLFGASSGPTNDNFFSGYQGAESDEFYQSGHVFFCASNNLALVVDEETGVFTGHNGLGMDRENEVRTSAWLSRFGQPAYLQQGGEGLRGARFRGAWYQPSEIYDPTSMFGYTIDSMPDIDTFGITQTGPATSELIFSAPMGGVLELLDPPDLTDLEGDYVAAANTVRTAAFGYTADISRVVFGELIIFGTAKNLPTLRVSIADGNGDPIPGTESEVLLWSGAGGTVTEESSPTIEYGEIFDDEHTFVRIVELPEAALPGFATAVGSLRIEILPDCAAEDSEATIDEAFLNLMVLKSVGNVFVMEGYDYSVALTSVGIGCATDADDGDAESDNDRPMSWPSVKFPCGAQTPAGVNGGRIFCSHPQIVTFVGEGSGDGLGWAHHGGDLDLDGLADVVFGAPLNDNDPGVDAAGTRTDNGKVYCVFGRPVLGGIGMPTEYERFELRGTHDDDQFGRVQGNASDTNGDSNDDLFFAAEGYDAVDGLNGVPLTGIDAGFVGILFGGQTSTGENGINVEQVGTLRYPGCKFIGGSAGARLGGSNTPHAGTALAISKGQHGVSSAGDFNLDGYNDLLISAPGQEWPGAAIQFSGPVVDGESVTINGVVFEFDTNGVVAPGRSAVTLDNGVSAEEAQKALISQMQITPVETLNVSSIRSQTQFPFPLPDIPTVTFLARRANDFLVGENAANITAETFIRQGVCYLVFGDNTLLLNKTFLLPDDLNRRDQYGRRVLKGVVFVSAYEKDTVGDATPDEAAIDAVARAGDIDGDGYVDILLGAPQADFINILSPDEQRRQASGEAYLIYGNEYGLNKGSAP